MGILYLSSRHVFSCYCNNLLILRIEQKSDYVEQFLMRTRLPCVTPCKNVLIEDNLVSILSKPYGNNYFLYVKTLTRYLIFFKVSSFCHRSKCRGDLYQPGFHEERTKRILSQANRHVSLYIWCWWRRNEIQAKDYHTNLPWSVSSKKLFIFIFRDFM